MSIKKNIVTSITLGIASFCLFVSPAFAHVIVYPKQVGIAQTQVFDMTVPTEKDNPTVGIKLFIPPWLHGDVVPNVKPGWTINIVKSGDVVTEIDWTGGIIPPGQRDDFYFQAQAPASVVILKWKAIQIYQDGSTVAWTHEPTANPEDDSAPPPYSTTKVIHDVANSQMLSLYNIPTFSFVLSVLAFVLSALALGTILLRKK